MSGPFFFVLFIILLIFKYFIDFFKNEKEGGRDKKNKIKPSMGCSLTGNQMGNLSTEPGPGCFSQGQAASFWTSFLLWLFSQVKNTLGPVRSSLVIKPLMWLCLMTMTLHSASPNLLWKSISVLCVPTHPNPSFQCRRWNLVASCPETLLRAARGWANIESRGWCLEAFWGLVWNRHRAKRMELLEPFPLSYHTQASALAL